MTEPSVRFVVLHHTAFGDPHFDLMIESAPGEALMTWRCPEWPLVSGDTLTRLANHRRAYLDYEGPISNNRGEVRRVAAGSCNLTPSSDQITIEFLAPDSSMVILRFIQFDRWDVVEVD